MQGTLYLIPTTLGDCDLHTVLPSYNSEIIKNTFLSWKMYERHVDF